MIDVESEVTGRVWQVHCEVGQQVEEDHVLMVLESMKMEIPVLAPADGTVSEVLVAVEESVDEDQVLVRLRN